MKKIELPKEAIFMRKGFGKELSEKKFWFYEEFESGNRKHWSMNLYDCGIVENKKSGDLDMSYQKYIMKFDDGDGWIMEFVFKDYKDPIFAGDFAIYLNDENISEDCEEYSDLAGCCKSAMYYMCSRV